MTNTPAALAPAAPTLASADPASGGVPLPISPGIMPTPAPAVSLFALIPAELFGFPIIAVIGTIIWLFIFVLIFKSYV